MDSGPGWSSELLILWEALILQCTSLSYMAS